MLSSSSDGINSSDNNEVEDNTVRQKGTPTMHHLLPDVSENSAQNSGTPKDVVGHLPVPKSFFSPRKKTSQSYSKKQHFHATSSDYTFNNKVDDYTRMSVENPHSYKWNQSEDNDDVISVQQYSTH